MTEKTVPERVYEGWQRSIDTVFEGKSKKKRLLLPAVAAIHTAVGALFCARALPLTELSLGVPLADAFICSAGAYAPFALLGVFIGAMRYGQANALRYITISLIAIARLITGRKRKETGRFFAEGPLTKTASAAVISLILTAFSISASVTVVLSSLLE